MDTTYQNKNKTPPRAKMEAEGLELSKSELTRWGEMIYGKDSLNAYIPKVKLIQHCVKCGEEAADMNEHHRIRHN